MQGDPPIMSLIGHRTLSIEVISSDKEFKDTPKTECMNIKEDFQPL